MPGSFELSCEPGKERENLLESETSAKRGDERLEERKIREERQESLYLRTFSTFICLNEKILT